MRVTRLAAPEFNALRRRAIFDCCKWDPQVGDVCTLAPFPLVLTPEAWAELCAHAGALARETLALERELSERPELHARLGLPRRARAALLRAAGRPSPGVARLVRFDFHYTPDGWRISEANSDVPGGLNEASGFPLLLAPHYAWAESVGDPCAAYVDAVIAGCDPGARVALVHATAYSDDNQMMTYLARRLEERGARPTLASPAHLSWHSGRAAGFDRVVRFFPADWLADLPADTAWESFYGGGLTPLSNPATALLTQSKRHPLVWEALRTPLPTWRALLPETRDPREVRWQGSDEWVLKPVLGRVGEDVAIAGLTTPQDRRRIELLCRLFPGSWVAQRRFELLPMQVDGERLYPCVGVYTVDDQVAGAYGRLAPRALIDGRASDAAVLAGVA